MAHTWRGRGPGACSADNSNGSSGPGTRSASARTSSHRSKSSWASAGGAPPHAPGMSTIPSSTTSTARPSALATLMGDLLDRHRTSLAGIDQTIEHRLYSCKSVFLDIVDFLCADSRLTPRRCATTPLAAGELPGLHRRTRKDPPMIRLTMKESPLTINAILRHGRRVHADSECVTFTGDGVRRASYRQVAGNAARLAGAPPRPGIGPGDPVGTFMWNDQEHLEAYFAVPCMGAVLHTLNIRLAPEQLVFGANPAEGPGALVESTLGPVLAPVASQLSTVEAWIVVGDGDASALADTGRPVHRYHELLAREQPCFDYPGPGELAAASMCYTSGTTGDPKGVVYSHRSTYLHSLGVC